MTVAVRMVLDWSLSLLWSRAYPGCMPPAPPTTLAVAAAITHFREVRDLTSAELAYLISLRGHQLSLDDILCMEKGERAVTVDDLVVLAHVLDVTPNALIGFVPMPPDAPDGGPIATGLPDDLAPGELEDWLDGHLGLDDASRAAWWQAQERRLEILSLHLEDQLAAAVEELRDLDDEAQQDADDSSAQRLYARIQEGELAVHDTGRTLDVIGMRLDELRGPQVD